MAYKMVKLKDVATYINGKAFKPTEWEAKGKPIIRIQNLNDKSKPFNYTSKEFEEKYAVRKGDILISWSASLGIFEWEGQDAWLNQHIFKVVFDGLEINKDYFKFAITNVLEHMQSLVHGATMKHITKGKFENIEIPLPPIRVQEKIASALNKAQDLINSRRAQIEKYDELLQSVFLDMFGDPVINPKRWKVFAIKNIVNKIDGGWSPKCHNKAADSNKWGVLKLSAVTGGKYNQNENKELPQEFEPKLEKEVKNQDLLMTRKNTPELVGDCSYVFDTRKKLMMPDLIFRFDTKDNVDKRFLWKLFTENKFKNKIKNLAGGSAKSMSNISKKKLMELNIIVPPLHLQNQFASIVEKVESEKGLCEESLRQMEENFNSIMKRAFKEELF